MDREGLEAIAWVEGHRVPRPIPTDSGVLCVLFSVRLARFLDGVIAPAALLVWGA